MCAGQLQCYYSYGVLTGLLKSISLLYCGKINWLLLKHHRDHLIIWRYAKCDTVYCKLFVVENFCGHNVLLKFVGKLLRLCHSCSTLLTSFMKNLLENFCGS